MNKIKILPDSVSNKIAAGEVIERPSSIVKELLENSLDASASSIKIIIETSGTKLISIIDDGEGMDQDDAILCIEPHATSKIKNAEDLFTIHTLGFRGEALPSIAAVSKLRIRTKPEGKNEGTELVIEGGKILSCSPAGCAKGTEVCVKDLFFNVPARKKFLRTLAVEEKQIIETIYSLAIANPDVSFELISDSREIFNSQGNKNFSSRIRTFFGKSAAENLLPVNFEEAGITISGLTAKHGYTRGSRKEQRVFINRRPAESPPVFAGIKDAYGSIVQHGRFPPVILFIDTDPSRVDVNVHPAKKEVRLKEPSLFKMLTEKALRETLRNSQHSTVHLSPNISLRNILDAAVVTYNPSVEKKKWETDSFLYSGQTDKKGGDADRTEKKDDSPESSFDSVLPAQEKEFPSLRIIGSLDATYILTSSPDGLVIIDQHAAHERIMYEKLLETLKDKRQYSQKLLIPITLELSGAEMEFIVKNSGEFAKVGFQIENFGKNTAIINGIPVGFPQDNITAFISDILDDLVSESKNGRTGELEIAKKACSSAVKAHEDLTLPEIENLIQMLAKCEMPFCCPHGRPVLINISIRELEKRFGRGVGRK
jgi:DNA mismatch repair protein MutL